VDKEKEREREMEKKREKVNFRAVISCLACMTIRIPRWFQKMEFEIRESFAMLWVD